MTKLLKFIFLLLILGFIPIFTLADAQYSGNVGSGNETGSYTLEEALEIQKKRDGYAQTIPEWVKNIALWYGQGEISEDEFVNALQYLVQKKILIIPLTSNTINDFPYKEYGEFSSITCHRDSMGWVVMVGKYTNGSVPYKWIHFDAILVDENGNVLAFDTAGVNEISSFETKPFEAEFDYSESFDHCEITIDYGAEYR